MEQSETRFYYAKSLLGWINAANNFGDINVDTYSDGDRFVLYRTDTFYFLFDNEETSRDLFKEITCTYKYR